jgi:Zn finger protein HypA/HybF involved in hydrogenase expression
VHELSLAMEICRMAEERLPPDGPPRLATVAVLVGEDAGVEAGALEFCLGALLAAPPFGAARPLVTRTAGDVFRLEYLEVDDDGPDDRSP